MTINIVKSIRTHRQEKKAHAEYMRELEIKAIVQEHTYALMSELSKKGML